MARKKAVDEIENLALAVESGDKVKLELPKSGKEIYVNNLTGYSTIRIARIIGKDILEIMQKIPGNAAMDEIAMVVLTEVHEDKVAEMFTVVFGSDELLHQNIEDIIEGLKQYVDKVGATQVFTMIDKGRGIVEKGLKDQAPPFAAEVAKNVKADK